MALAKLLGFDPCSRLKSLKDRHLSLPRGTPIPASIEQICRASVDLKRIGSHWEHQSGISSNRLSELGSRLHWKLRPRCALTFAESRPAGHARDATGIRGRANRYYGSHVVEFYYTGRPHSSPGDLTPEEFAAGANPELLPPFGRETALRVNTLTRIEEKTKTGKLRTQALAVLDRGAAQVESDPGGSSKFVPPMWQKGDVLAL